MTDLVIHNVRVMTCDPARPGLGVIDHGAVVVSGGVIRWVGRDTERPRQWEAPLSSDPRDATRGGVNGPALPVQRGREGPLSIDGAGRLVTPGLVDCHTHAIFAGERAGEFGMRAAGSRRRSDPRGRRVMPS